MVRANTTMFTNIYSGSALMILPGDLPGDRFHPLVKREREILPGDLPGDRFHPLVKREREILPGDLPGDRFHPLVKVGDCLDEALPYAARKVERVI